MPNRLLLAAHLTRHPLSLRIRCPRLLRLRPLRRRVQQAAILEFFVDSIDHVLGYPVARIWIVHLLQVVHPGGLCCQPMFDGLEGVAAVAVRHCVELVEGSGL